MDEKITLAPMIKGIVPGLPEIGKIKIGMKGEVTKSRGGKTFQLPQKVDHFIITTLERGADGNFLRDEAIHQNLGAKPKSIEVSLLYDDPALNFTCRWACFTGTQLWCTGDGEYAYRKQQDDGLSLLRCPCERNQPDFDDDQYRCKPSGVLSVILNDMQVVGGVYKFRTTSYNSVINLMSSLALIQRITGGVLAGIPLNMTVRPKTVIIPKTQKKMTVYVVGLEYRGTIQQLSEVGYKAALENATHRARIEDIEAIAKKAIEPNLMLTAGETETDIANEFYPEAVNDANLPKTVIVTPEDFDAEFSDEMQDPLWVDHWGKAVKFHQKEKGWTEDELKVDIILSGAAGWRLAFNKFSTAMQKAKKATKSDGSKAKPKKTPTKKTAAQKKKDAQELLASDAWQTYVEFRAENSEIWAHETGGAEPKSVAECDDVNIRIGQRLDALEGDGDEMPG